MIRRIVALLVAAALMWVGLQQRGKSTSQSPSIASPAPTAAAPPFSPGTSPPPPVASSVGFRSRERLEEHYRKHGAEFGKITIEEYLHRAQALRDATVGGDVLEVTRPTDGVVSRFDRATSAFLAFDADGTIRTFFKPNDGEAYFRRQANRRPSP